MSTTKTTAQPPFPAELILFPAAALTAVSVWLLVESIDDVAVTGYSPALLERAEAEALAALQDDRRKKRRRIDADGSGRSSTKRARTRQYTELDRKLVRDAVQQAVDAEMRRRLEEFKAAKEMLYKAVSQLLEGLAVGFQVCLESKLAVRQDAVAEAVQVSDA